MKGGPKAHINTQSCGIGIEALPPIQVPTYKDYCKIGIQTDLRTVQSYRIEYLGDMLQPGL